MKTIIVASKNPVKLQATLAGFQKMFPDEEWSVEGIHMDSGVGDQPNSDEETLQGAENRARRLKRRHPSADFWVGIEGGLEEKNETMFTFAWVIVLGKDGAGMGRTTSFQLPPKVARQIKQGLELGEAMDKLFSKVYSKQKEGAIGILSDGVIDRTQLYTPAVIAALIPMKKHKLYRRFAVDQK